MQRVLYVSWWLLIFAIMLALLALSSARTASVCQLPDVESNFHSGILQRINVGTYSYSEATLRSVGPRVAV